MAGGSQANAEALWLDAERGHGTNPHSNPTRAAPIATGRSVSCHTAAVRGELNAAALSYGAVAWDYRERADWRLLKI